MSPRSEYAKTAVHSSVVKSHDATAILVDAGGLTPTRWFVEHGLRAAQKDENRPKKRQKTSKLQRSQILDTIHPESHSFEHPKLFELSIDFDFGSTGREDKSYGFVASRENDLPVHMIDFMLTDDFTTFRFKLPTSESPVLSLDCGANLPESIIRMLRAILFVRSPAPRVSWRQQRKIEKPASIVLCSISRSLDNNDRVVRLNACLYWNSGTSAFGSGTPRGGLKYYPDYATLIDAFPNNALDNVDDTLPWTPQDFYGSVHVPPKSNNDAKQHIEVLVTPLYPFQERSVGWMLKREGVQYVENAIFPLPQSARQANVLEYFQTVQDLRGKTCYVDHLRGILSRWRPSDGSSDISGGILAEEMGLGKTVELISLIKLHSRVHSPKRATPVEETATTLVPSKATLIITPAAILQQWKSEFERHAPSLRVFQYDGLPHGQNYQGKANQLLQDMAVEYDVVLATYQTLSKEIHFAEDPPKREMRHAPRFDRKRSPLVRLYWWRICLDEAQMVESGVTAAARVACRLPRVHSWAVSGTPLRKEAQDLRGLLVFLRFKPFSDDSVLWDHVIKNHRYLFRKIFATIALRHTKAHVRDELILPPQKRIVVNMSFTAMEEQNYKQLFEEMCHEVGLSVDGSPWRENWDRNDPAVIESMRSWLSRLRQTCLHPQIGTKNRKALGRGSRPLQTASEVLEALMEQNEGSLREKQASAINFSLIRAHILGNNRADPQRSEKALTVYEEAMKASADLLAEARKRLQGIDATLDIESNQRGGTNLPDVDSAGDTSPLLGILRNVLRNALQQHHTCTFFVATSFYRIKVDTDLTPPDSKRFEDLDSKEEAYYEMAKALRQELLKETGRKAEKLIKAILDTTWVDMPRLKDLRHSGLRSQRIVNAANALFDIVQEQVQIIIRWRTKMADYLTKPLVDKDEDVELTGDEYENSTKQQDELYVYFDAYKAMVADLKSFITGESSPLTDHESRFAVIAAQRYLDPEVPDAAPVHAPELALELFAVRNKFRASKDEVASVRGLVQDARTLENLTYGSGNALTATNERQIAHDTHLALQTIYSSYSKALVGLEKELELFRSAQNQRVEFYRQLQEISDDVAPYKQELDETLDERALNEIVTKEQITRQTVAQLEMKRRFLLTTREEADAQIDAKVCIICHSAFMRGTLTVCGHQYCAECLDYWWRAHRTCPICKRRLRRNDIYDIVLRPQIASARLESNNAGYSSPCQATKDQSAGCSLYTDVDSSLMDEIRTIDLPVSYGTKIDTLGRHLKWLREHDPGSKSIIFSQYREFLDVLGSALAQFKIGCTRLGHKKQAAEHFKQDPKIDCLLLDAKTDSSGLTLVDATHVFICEPLVQTAVELQAIARVHRIGQLKPTTVWMYIISDTVEESIYRFSVARRLAHVQSHKCEDSRAIGKFASHRKSSSAPHAIMETQPLFPVGSGLSEIARRENAIDAANLEEIELSGPLSRLLVAGRSGGERVSNEDLWNCLFGHVQKKDALTQESGPVIGFGGDGEDVDLSL